MSITNENSVVVAGVQSLKIIFILQFSRKLQTCRWRSMITDIKTLSSQPWSKWNRSTKQKN